MSDNSVGEIRMFAGNFAPRGWSFCDGQLLDLNQFDALFSLLGTFYGGDGRTTFGLPDLRGRLPIHMGTGPGLTTRPLGQMSGSETASLTTAQLPMHTHKFGAATTEATATNPTDAVIAQGVGTSFYAEAAPDTALASRSLNIAGGNQEHDNLMPALCVNFIIALTGLYPSRT